MSCAPSPCPPGPPNPNSRAVLTAPSPEAVSIPTAPDGANCWAFGNDATSYTATCGSLVGADVTVTVPPGTYASGESRAAANAEALAAAQAEAEAQLSCLTLYSRQSTSPDHATMCGFEEFTPGVKPNFYLHSSLTGTMTTCLISSPTCDLSGICGTSAQISFSGSVALYSGAANGHVAVTYLGKSGGLRHYSAVVSGDGVQAASPTAVRGVIQAPSSSTTNITASGFIDVPDEAGVGTLVLQIFTPLYGWTTPISPASTCLSFGDPPCSVTTDEWDLVASYDGTCTLSQNSSGTTATTLGDDCNAVGGAPTSLSCTDPNTCYSGYVVQSNPDTLTERWDGIGCAAGVSTAKSVVGVLTKTLSNQFTEADAIAAFDAAATLGSWVLGLGSTNIWENQTARTFAFQRSFFKGEGFGIANSTYSIDITVGRRAYGTSDPFVDYQTLTYHATTDNAGTLLVTDRLPNYEGFEAKVTAVSNPVLV